MSELEIIMLIGAENWEEMSEDEREDLIYQYS